MEPITGALCAILGGGVVASGVRYLWHIAGIPSWQRRLKLAEIDAHTETERARAAAAADLAAAAAAAQPRSYTMHYAPHISGGGASSPPLPQVVGAAADLGAGELPPAVDLADLHFPPHRGAILLALGPGGQPLTVPARDLMHTGLVGASGGGKSNTGRLILAQLLACGVDCVIADPHYTPFDAESGEDWRPIARRLKIAPARKAGEIEDLFAWLGEHMHQRYDRRDRGERPGPPVVAYVDELPAIVADVPGAMDTLSRLLREGRKVGVYLVSASQDLLVSTLKSGGEIRENLRSCYYSGGAGTSAVQLLDMPKRDIGQYESRLGRGVVLLRSAATPATTLARVPLASNRAVSGLLSDDAATLTIETPQKAARNPAESAVENASAAVQTPDPEAARILAMFAGGESMRGVVKAVYGVSGGGRYNELLAHVQTVIRESYVAQE